MSRSSVLITWRLLIPPDTPNPPDVPQELVSPQTPCSLHPFSECSLGLSHLSGQFSLPLLRAAGPHFLPPPPHQISSILQVSSLSPPSAARLVFYFTEKSRSNTKKLLIIILEMKNCFLIELLMSFPASFGSMILGACDTWKYMVCLLPLMYQLHEGKDSAVSFIPEASLPKTLPGTRTGPLMHGLASCGFSFCGPKIVSGNFWK